MTCQHELLPLIVVIVHAGNPGFTSLASWVPRWFHWWLAIFQQGLLSCVSIVSHLHRVIVTKIFFLSFLVTSEKEKLKVHVCHWCYFILHHEQILAWSNFWSKAKKLKYIKLQQLKQKPLKAEARTQQKNTYCPLAHLFFLFSRVIEKLLILFSPAWTHSWKFICYKMTMQSPSIHPLRAKCLLLTWVCVPVAMSEHTTPRWLPWLTHPPDLSVRSSLED